MKTVYRMLRRITFSMAWILRSWIRPAGAEAHWEQDPRS